MLDNLFNLRSNMNQAINSNNIKYLQQLIEQETFKINLNYIDKDGETLLHRACLLNRFEIVEMLCKNGASQNIMNKQGWFPIHIAAYHSHMDILIYLLKREQNNDDLAVFDYETNEYETTCSSNEDETNDLLFNFSNLKL